MSSFFSLQLKPKRGFTLIELMIAVSIIAILSAVGLVTYNSARMIARDAKRKADLKAIAQALELFYTEYQRYPCSSSTGAVNSSPSNASWLTDTNTAECLGYTPPVGSTSINLAPTYMSSVPRDPLSTGIYHYFYYSSGTNTWGTGSPCGNKDFILWAQLENQNDPDRAALSSRIICGSIRINDSNNFSSNAYVIKLP